MQSARSGVVVEGIQRCFCMDIQRSERDSTKASTTQKLSWTLLYCRQIKLGTN
jgi:hypothetical protein